MIDATARTYTVNGGAATSFGGAADEFVISQSGAGSTTNTVAVTNHTVDYSLYIRIAGVNIDVSATSGACAFDIEQQATYLTLVGENTLKSGDDCAGLHVFANPRLTIYNNYPLYGDGSLTAIGGAGAAGIGGYDPGNLVIDGSVQITAIGGDAGGAGIGGIGGGGGNITIQGDAQVTAIGGDAGGAGIGSGTSTRANNITITGNASVTATGGSHDASSPGGAGIGGGANGWVGGTIAITGNAQVVATGKNGGAGIGSGGTSNTTPRSAGTIVINTTGKVTTTGGEGDGANVGDGTNIGHGGYFFGPGSGLSWFRHPFNSTATVGANIRFEIDLRTTGAPPSPTFAWEVSTDGGATWAATGTSSHQLDLAAVTAAMDGNLYRVTLTLSGGSWGAGSSITYHSHVATLRVIDFDTEACGGGIFNEGGGLALINMTVFGNTAESGGGICNHEGELDLINSTVSNNTAEKRGGGIANNGRLFVGHSTLSGNEAGERGGGISVDSFNTVWSYFFVWNSTLTGNTAGRGGGIDNEATRLDESGFAHATLVGNVPHDFYATTELVLWANNTIFGSCGTPFSSYYYAGPSHGNLDGGNNCGFTGANNKNNATLALGPLQDNGGPTLTMMPGINSDAIGFGIDALCYGVEIDQRGVERPPVACTSGAVEALFGLTVTVNGSGSVSDNHGEIIGCIAGPCSGNYADGTLVTLTANPFAGNTFTGWSGDCAGSALSVNVTMNAARSCTATFAPTAAVTYTLTVTVNGDGSVSDNLAQIVGCVAGPCSGSYADGTLVTLTATPNAGNTFVSWSGACAAAGDALSVDVTMDAARSCTATFAPIAAPTFALTVTVNGNGSVSDNLAQIIGCAAGPCSGNYADGTLVTLTAEPAWGYMFNGWSGACVSFGNAHTATVTMSEARSCGAAFIEIRGPVSGATSIPTLSQWTLLLLGLLVAGIACWPLSRRYR